MQRLYHALERVLDILFPPRKTQVLVRDATMAEMRARLTPRPVPPYVHGDFPSHTALLTYTDPLVQACILETKFHGSMRAAALLAEVLAEYLSHHLQHTNHVTNVTHSTLVCIPVPLSSERLKERGYNQVIRVLTAAHTLAGNPIWTIDTGTLIRTRNTSPQTSLGGDARRNNLSGAFAIAKPFDPHLIYMVIDDVTTTGTTLFEACHTLRRAGASHVCVLALAH